MTAPRESADCMKQNAWNGWWMPSQCQNVLKLMLLRISLLLRLEFALSPRSNDFGTHSVLFLTCIEARDTSFPHLKCCTAQLWQETSPRLDAAKNSGGVFEHKDEATLRTYPPLLSKSTQHALYQSNVLQLVPVNQAYIAKYQKQRITSRQTKQTAPIGECHADNNRFGTKIIT